MDRRETVEVFRRNLSEVIERSGLSRSAFAARLGLDRSTLSQLLSPANLRLPRAEAIAAIAASEQVSVDRLLGLSQEGQIGADMVGQEMEIAPGGASPADERLAYSRRPETDMEVRSSFQSVEVFARREGIWRPLPAETRRRQILAMVRLLDELYPTFRWFL